MGVKVSTEEAEEALNLLRFSHLSVQSTAHVADSDYCTSNHSVALGKQGVQ